MNDRQRFLATMHYLPRDRAPLVDFGFWGETILEWHKQGLPAEVTYLHSDTTLTNKFFGMDSYTGGVSGETGLSPLFEEKVIEDRGDYEIAMDANGVLLQRKKFMATIPEHLGHTLVDRVSWEKQYKWRLDPASPERYPTDWAAARKIWNDPDSARVHVCFGGSFYGWIRDWMGVEAVSYLVYDDPRLLEEMVETLTECKLAVLQKMFDQGARYDACALWEDMCFNNGPLLAPEQFKRILVPRIKRYTDLLRRHGCDVIWVDCDGKIDELVPLWLEAGVNCMFPIEVGTWRGDPVAFRKQYGRDLLMMGGFDKRILARDKREIEREVQRLTPLVEEGGYIPMPDHRVPPDVPLKNYLFYLETIRKVWGKGVNLKPIGKITC